MPTVIRDPAVMQRAALDLRAQGKRIGLVPTMGALHEGHLALIRRARVLADAVIATIFVNPLQFAPAEDLARYPRPFERDVASAGLAGAAIVFAPEDGAIYPPGFQTSVLVEAVTAVLEGAARPAHFRGVTTVVAKLFNLTQPHVAVFGQKDGQQVVVIRRMVRDLNIPVELEVLPTVREADGLAMSSRNAYLTPAERREAPVLYEALEEACRLVAGHERRAAGVRERMAGLIAGRSTGAVEYISIADAETLEELTELRQGVRIMISLAVRFGTTRLIDNAPLEVP
jgi:pantoate--beta-alanine ligase